MARSWEDHWQIVDETSTRNTPHAVVRKVAALDDGREGALKVLTAAAHRQEERRFRFREETNALKALSAGVPELFDTNTNEAGDPETLFMVMEWIPGPTLQERVNRGVLRLDEALDCTDKIVETIAHMHELPLVHRDLKPDNVILRSESIAEPVVIDLGLAWSESRASDDFDTEFGQEMGNRFFRLPEFAPGRAHRDPRSDVTLVAGLLLFMIAGRAPRILRDEHGRAPHEALLPDIAQELINDNRWPKLKRVFNVAFQPEVEARYQSIADLRTSLSNLAPDTPSVDALTPALERLQGHVESSRWQSDQERRKKVGEICAAFDQHLRTLLKKSGLSLPGGHGFDHSGTAYRGSIGLQMPNISGGTVCSLHYSVTISDKEFTAGFSVDRQLGEVIFAGPISDFEGLREALWANADRMVAAAIDNFREQTAI